MNTDLLARLSAFVVERHPFALAAVTPVLRQCAEAAKGDADILRAQLETALRQALTPAPDDALHARLPETTPRVDRTTVVRDFYGAVWIYDWDRRGRLVRRRNLGTGETD